MSETETKFEWYNYRALDARNALWSFVGGPRSIGKTYGAKLDKAVKYGLKTERQTLWLRRSLTELTPAKAGFFDTIAPLYPGFEFRVEGDEGQIRLDGETWLTIIRFAALSVAYQMKGTEYPLVDLIVYDECFAEPTEDGKPGKYLPDEVNRLRNLWVTINRNRIRPRGGRAQCRVLLLGNVTDEDNPWFLEFGFDKSREWQKSQLAGGDVVLHLVDSSKYEARVTESIYGRVLGERMINHAQGDYFGPSRSEVVDARDPESKPFCTLVTMRGIFGLWQMPDYQDMYVTVGPLAAPEAPVITFEPMAVRPGVPLADSKHFIRNEVRRAYRRGSMRYVTSGALASKQALAR